MVDPDDRRSRTVSIRDGFLDIWLASIVSRTLREGILRLAECRESFYRRPGGPFDRTGRPSQSELVNWPLSPRGAALCVLEVFSPFGEISRLGMNTGLECGPEPFHELLDECFRVVAGATDADAKE